MYINYEDLQCKYIIASTRLFFVHPGYKLHDPNKNSGLSMITKLSLFTKHLYELHFFLDVKLPFVRPLFLI